MFFMITLGIYLAIAVTIILTVATTFPEVVFFIYLILSFGFANETAWSLSSLNFVGNLKHVADFLQLHLLPINSILKISLMITVVLVYLAISIFINERGYTIFKIINNLVGVGFYGILIYFACKPNVFELLGMIALVAYILVPLKMAFYEKVSSKINEKVKSGL